jgi:probable F420-dependent oxidoreductase
LSGRVGVCKDRRIDMGDHLVSLARRAGIDPLVQRRFRDEGEGVRLLLRHRRFVEVVPNRRAAFAAPEGCQGESFENAAPLGLSRMSALCRRVLAMRYGFYLPTRGRSAEPDALETLVTRGEALGFHSTVIADHVVFPVTIASKYPYTVSGAFPGGGDALEQLTLMSFVAAKSQRLRLISSVMILPHRNPVLTAKMLATIDVLSRGRVTVGVGVGWLREEFAALGAADFDRRGAISDEYLRIFKTLWTQNPASFSGEFYHFESIKCLPQPVQKPHPPIWIGGHSRAALRRAARHGDGWHPVGANPAAMLAPPEFKTLLDELRRLTEAEGRDPRALTISYKAPLYDAGVPAGGVRRPFSGTADQVLDDIATYAGLGVSELIFDFRSEEPKESLERMERFAEVMKRARV